MAVTKNDIGANDDIGRALVEICEAAAGVILPLWRSGLNVERKVDDSPVTEADRRGETLILARLAARFPHVPVISEEDASEFGTPDAIGSRFFLVDPLDGTKAFVRGDPNFTVNIGLIQDGRPVAGAVVAPVTGEAWFTHAGGAMKRLLGGPAAPIRARPWPQGQAVAVTSLTMRAEALAALAAAYGFATTQQMDSSIKFCRIAEGSADIYARQGPTMEWDIAAGHAVLQAAGGSVTTLEGAEFRYAKVEEGFRNGGFVARGA